MSNISSCIEQMNTLGKAHIPFIFIVDFLAEEPILMPINEQLSDTLLFDINGFRNFKNNIPLLPGKVQFQPQPLDEDKYKAAFGQAMHHLERGDSYLLNLTMPILLDSNLNLNQIFHHSKASYKLQLKNRFVVFSPEPFIRISNGIIAAHPMKGTIDATLPNAEALLMNDEKELAEHYTIVDLLRNDLSMVAESVKVDRFRYIEEIQTIKGRLLQTSSHISGRLPSNYTDNIGDIFFRLLPAGSITGAPKKKTVEVIRAIEPYNRGFYTGVFGWSDGYTLDSGVMIRFIEKTPKGLVYKAGGGITVNSLCKNEYDELMQKVYLPFF